MKTKQQAFTLIELLVVITIIGIISTIGIATFNGYIEKAHTTKVGTVARNFSLELKRQAVEKGVSAIGIWKYENNHNDSSSNGNSLINSIAPLLFQSSDNIFLDEYYGYYNDGRTYVDVNAPVDGEFTVSYMIKYPIADEAGYPIYFTTNIGQITNNGINGDLYFHPFNVTLNNTVNDEKWHHVIFTYKDDTFKVWLDGELAGQNTYSLGALSTINRIYVGYGNANGADMYFDNLEVYPFAVEPNL